MLSFRASSDLLVVALGDLSTVLSLQLPQRGRHDLFGTHMVQVSNISQGYKTNDAREAIAAVLSKYLPIPTTATNTRLRAPFVPLSLHQKRKRVLALLLLDFLGWLGFKTTKVIGRKRVERRRQRRAVRAIRRVSSVSCRRSARRHGRGSSGGQRRHERRRHATAAARRRAKVQQVGSRGRATPRLLGVPSHRRRPRHSPFEHRLGGRRRRQQTRAREAVTRCLARG